MEIEFDQAKDAANVSKHGVSLAQAVDLVILASEPDERFAYGEARYRAFGLLDGRPYCLAFTLRNGKIRALSLRRMHRKEYLRHVP